MNQVKKPLILVVDDNTNNLQVLGSMLQQNGYETAIAMNGEKALKFLRNIKPDLILLDIMMPGMDGYEVCKKIKQEYDTQHIPIIFLTAKTETEDIVKGFEVGGVDYVTKPFNSAELLARVSTHVEMKKLRGMIPICAKCKKIRQDKNYWEEIEVYITNHSDANFTHGICPDCAEELYGEFDWYKKAKNKIFNDDNGEQEN